MRDRAVIHHAVLRIFQHDCIPDAAVKLDPAHRDLLRALHADETVQRRNAHLVTGKLLRRPEVKRVRALIEIPLAGRVEFFERVLKMEAVVRMDVVAAVLREHQLAVRFIETFDRHDEIPPAIHREDVDLHVLRMRPVPHILLGDIKLALPFVAFVLPLRNLLHARPAAVERVVRIEVRPAREDHALAIKEKLPHVELLQRELRDIRFQDRAFMLREFLHLLRSQEHRLLAVRGLDDQIIVLRFYQQRLGHFISAAVHDDGRQSRKTRDVAQQLLRVFQRGTRISGRSLRGVAAIRSDVDLRGHQACGHRSCEEHRKHESLADHLAGTLA